MKKALLIMSLMIVFLLTGCKDTEDPATTEQEKIAEYESSWGFDFLDEVPQAQRADAHPVADAFDGGDGSPENPYQIADADQLALLAQCINDPPESYDGAHYRDASYVLTADIVWNDTSDVDAWLEDAPAYAWEPIGMYEPFSGNFDGGGHSISGLYIVSAWQPGTTDVGNEPTFGLFGQLYGSTDQSCSVRNVNVTDSVYRIYNVAYEIGGIAGKASNTVIENCTFDGVMLCRGGNDAGGIVASTRNTEIRKCTFSGTLQGEAKVYTMAGIAADATGVTIEQCINKGTIVPSEDSNIGGIVAELMDATEFVSDKAEGDMTWTLEGHDVQKLTSVIDCTNYADLPYGGGIVGHLAAMRSNVAISGCINEGNIGSKGDSVSSAGGIVGSLSCYGDNPDINPGFLSYVEIQNCSNNGAIGGAEGSNLGGILGSVRSQDGATLTLSNCSNTGNVSGTEQLGGILGNLAMYSTSTVALDGCQNNADILGAEGGIGGLVGSACFVGNSTGRNFSCVGGSNTGAVSGSGYGVGGILGTSLEQKGTEGEIFQINGCTNSGVVTCVLPGIVGGVVGYLPGGGEELAVINCINSGRIFVSTPDGWTWSEVKPAYFAFAGGVAGAVQDTAQIDNCASTETPETEEENMSYILIGDQVGQRFDEDPVLGF